MAIQKKEGNLERGKKGAFRGEEKGLGPG